MITLDYKGFEINVHPHSKFYHGTSSMNEESIMVQGLGPLYSEWSNKHIWLDTDISSAYNWSNRWGGTPTIFMVYAKDLDLTKLQVDYNNIEFFDEIILEKGYLDFYDMTFTYEGIIEPDILRIVEY